MKTITLQTPTRSIEALYFSESDDIKPGIIFIHDLMGIVDATKQVAQLLAEEGYHVLVPNLYTGVGQVKYCVRQIFETAMRNNEADSPHLAEIHAILDQFKARPEVDERQIGMVGQCLTGGFILHMAMRPEVKAPVVFHHSFGLKGSGMPSACAQLVQNKIQGHFVHIDPFCPKNRVGKLKNQLGDQLEEYWYHLPHGIPHFFFKNDQGKQALQRMVAFMHQQLHQAESH